MSSDKYRAHFEEPPLPNNVVLNFSDDTMEACMMPAVLAYSAGDSVRAVVGSIVLETVSMGGVGKAVALQGLCYEPEVQNKYFDGIFYVSLGQGAAEEEVIEVIAHFVEGSGGKHLARDITNRPFAESAARQASLWFKNE